MLSSFLFRILGFFVYHLNQILSSFLKFFFHSLSQSVSQSHTVAQRAERCNVFLSGTHLSTFVHQARKSPSAKALKEQKVMARLKMQVGIDINTRLLVGKLMSWLLQGVAKFVVLLKTKKKHIFYNILLLIHQRES